jgi:hypothetical protein
MFEGKGADSLLIIGALGLAVILALMAIFVG